MKKVFLLSVLGASLLLTSCFTSSEEIDSKLAALEKTCKSSYSDNSYDASVLIFGLLAKRGSMTEKQKAKLEKIMSNCTVLEKEGK